MPIRFPLAALVPRDVSPIAGSVIRADRYSRPVLKIKNIQFADDTPRGPYLDCAPFSLELDGSHLTFAVTVDDGGTSGWDFWGQAIARSFVEHSPAFEPSLGQIVVSDLTHDEVVSALSDLLAKHDSYVSLWDDLVFEDGE
jgi:hypothetical protein